MSNIHIFEACENIDAGFFSGDVFHNVKELEAMDTYIARWTRESAVIKKNMTVITEDGDYQYPEEEDTADES